MLRYQLDRMRKDGRSLSILLLTFPDYIDTYITLQRHISYSVIFTWKNKNWHNITPIELGKVLKRLLYVIFYSSIQYFTPNSLTSLATNNDCLVWVIDPFYSFYCVSSKVISGIRKPIRTEETTFSKCILKKKVETSFWVYVNSLPISVLTKIFFV